MTTSVRAARPRVLMIGVFGALFGLSALLAGIVIQLADSGWRFTVLVLPIVFACLTGVEVRRSSRKADEPDPGTQQ